MKSKMGTVNAGQTAMARAAATVGREACLPMRSSKHTLDGQCEAVVSSHGPVYERVGAAAKMFPVCQPAKGCQAPTNSKPLV